MNIKTILKTTGSLDLLLGVLLLYMLVFSVETIAPSFPAETLLYVRGFADVVAACNLGIGFLLIISSSIRDFHSARKVLLGELTLNVFLINSCCLKHNKCRHSCRCSST